MKPLSSRVLVKPEEDKTQTTSGLYLPTDMKSVQTGEVISVGPGTYSMSGELIPMEIAEGDQVIFPKDRGVELEDADGNTLLLLDEADLYCIL